MPTTLPSVSETALVEAARKNGWSTRVEPGRAGARVVTFLRGDDDPVKVAFMPNGRVGWARTAQRRLAPTSERVGQYLRTVPRKSAPVM